MSEFQSKSKKFKAFRAKRSQRLKKRIKMIVKGVQKKSEEFAKKKGLSLQGKGTASRSTVAKSFKFGEHGPGEQYASRPNRELYRPKKKPSLVFGGYGKRSKFSRRK